MLKKLAFRGFVLCMKGARLCLDIAFGAQRKEFEDQLVRESGQSFDFPKFNSKIPKGKQ